MAEWSEERRRTARVAVRDASEIGLGRAHEVRLVDISMTGARLMTRALGPAVFGGLKHRAFSLRLSLTRSTDGESISDVHATVVWAAEAGGHTTIGVKWPSSVSEAVRSQMIEWMGAST